MDTFDLKKVNLFFEEKLKYCEENLNFKLDNEILAEKLQEMKESKEQINSLNRSIYNYKLDLNKKDNTIIRLQYEKKIIIEDNNILRKKIKYLEIQDILKDIISKSFDVINKKEFNFALKKKESLKLNEFVLKNSKEKLVLFKKNLMNSTKKRKKKVENDNFISESIKEIKETDEYKKKKILSKLLKKKEKRKKTNNIKSNEDSLKKSLKIMKKTEKKIDLKKKNLPKETRKKTQKKTSIIKDPEKYELYNFSFSNSKLKSKKKIKNEKKNDSKIIKNFFQGNYTENSVYKTASFINNEIEVSEKSSKIYLRIKKEFPINSFEIIKNVKRDFNLEDVFFKNDNNPQDEIHKLFNKLKIKKKNIFFLIL